jgi:D-alanine-D-alanine ligase
VKKKNAVILHNQVGPDSPKDELDVLVQVEAVHRSLVELGYRVRVIPFSLDVGAALHALHRAAPLFVFNLVETVAGDGRLIHLAPALLDHVGMPYTGSGQEAIFVTSNKILSKRLFQQAGIPTPSWMEAVPTQDIPWSGAGTYLLKSVWEHASNWFGDDSVVHAGSASELRGLLERKDRRGEFFAERYIEGREFNQALLAGECLPAAEMRFVDYPGDKLRIVDFRAKWEEDSFEYAHTQRGFDLPAADQTLVDELHAVSRRCWESFGLAGYARVDFRVDAEGHPWVLEINTNPCLAPDGGFFAAAERAGMSFTGMVEKIVEDCLKRRDGPRPQAGGKDEQR